MLEKSVAAVLIVVDDFVTVVGVVWITTGSIGFDGRR
jgi:hypothetical protein